MSFLSKNNALTIGLVVIVLLGVGYLFFFSGNDVPDVTTDSAASSPQEFLFVSLASQLNTIEFDQAVFQDPRFAALADLKTQILPETAGREDPFAPIPGVKVSE